MSEAQGGAPSAPQAAPSALDVGSQPVESQEMESQVEGSEESSEQEEVPPSPKKIKQLKLKVHGEELSEELPFEIEENPEAIEYLTKQLQLSKAAQRAMQEKSSFEQQVKQFFQGFKSDTKSALKQMGIDPKEFAAAVIEEEIKNSQLTPEQRELEELKAEKRRLEEERKKEREEFEQKELERLRQVEYERIDNQITEALDSSDLPKTPYTVRKLAEYMLYGSQNGIELSAKDVLPIVREELLGDLKTIIESLGDDAAEEFIGKEVLNRFRKKNLAKAKQTPATVKAAIKDVGNSSKQKESEPVQKKSFKDFFGY